jgi:hypothetical protein
MTTKAKIGAVIALTTVLASPALAATYNQHQRSWSAYGAADQGRPFAAPGVIVEDPSYSPSNTCGRIGDWNEGYPGSGQCP